MSNMWRENSNEEDFDMFAPSVELVRRLVQSIGNPMPDDPWIIDPKI